MIVFLSQFALGYLVLYPALYNNNIEVKLNIIHFILLIITTITITANGYIINDLFDQKVDQLNKPSLTRFTPSGEKQVRNLYRILSFLGFLLSVYLAYHVGQIYLCFIYLAIHGLLYFYSYRLKSIPGLGNVLVSFLCAGVIYILLFAENQALQELAINNNPAYLQLTHIFLAFIIFAFLITFYREIIKDLEDIKGDAVHQKNTLAVVLGIELCKKFAMGVGWILTILVVAWIFFQINIEIWRLSYLIATILLPTLLSIYLLYKAKGPSEFKRISTLLKWVMLMGLIYVLIMKI